MSQPWSLMSKVETGVAKVRSQVIEQAVNAYFNQLPDKTVPSADQASAATGKAVELIKDGLLRSADLAVVADQADVPLEALKKSVLSIWRFLPELKLPQPVSEERLPAWRLGIVGAIGALLGIMILTPVMRLGLGMADVGMFLGGPLGCLAAISFVLWLSRRKWVRRAVPFLAAGGGLAYIYVKIKGMVLPSFFRKRFSIRGVIVPAMVIAAAWLARPKLVFDKNSHRESVRCVMETWFDCVVYMTVVNCFCEGSEPPTDKQKQNVLAKLAQYVYAIELSSANERSLLVEEMLQEAQNMGFEQLGKKQREQPESFLWRASYDVNYRRYGEINDGDMVRIEEPPVIYRGQTIARGLVRKVKNG